jgi:hypothetical protein
VLQLAALAHRKTKSYDRASAFFWSPILVCRRSKSPVSALCAYCCVWFKGHRRTSAGPINLSHWPSLWHPCREQKSSAARTASPWHVTRADSSDALGQKALHHPIHASDIPPSRTPQDFCLDTAPADFCFAKCFIIFSRTSSARLDQLSPPRILCANLRGNGVSNKNW